MKKKIDGLLLAVLITVGIFALMLLPYWVNQLPFEYGGDLKPTYFPYYTEFRNLMGEFLRGNGLPFYSWNLFLGNNFWSSKSFYILGDIYYYISLLWDTHFYNLFTMQTFLKTVVSVMSCYALCATFGFSKKASVTSSVCYGFSSWILFFLGQPMFISAYSFIPLYFVGMELYLRKNKLTVFLLSTALILFTNYYIFFALSVFSPVYFLCRYYAIHQTLKGWFLSALKLVGIYLTGALCTAVLILPSALYIMQNDRVGTFYFSLTFDNIRIYFHQLQSMLIPSQNIIYHDYNIFETHTHVTRELCLWAGSVTALLVPQFLTDKDVFYRRSMMAMYGFLVLTLLIPSGNMVMLGFSSPSFRWTYLFILMNLMTSCRYLSNPELINKKNLLISGSVIVAICLLNMPACLAVVGELGSFAEHIKLYLLSVQSAVFFIAFVWVLLKHKKTMNFVLVLTVLEVSLYSVTLIGFTRRKDDSTWEFIDKATSVLGEEEELNHYLDGFDDVNYSSYYRVYVPHDSLYWAYSHNHNLHYGIQGVMTYDSTYAPSFNDMKEIAPQVKAFDSEWIFNIQDPDLIDFLNVKYAVVISEDELPHENFKLITDTYRGSLMIYENLNYRSVGTTYSTVVTYDDFDGDLSDLMDTVICHAEDYDAISSLLGSSSAVLENIDYHNNYFYGTCVADDDEFMVLSLPYDEGWSVSVNGEKVETYRVNGGVMGFAIEEGYNEVIMNFVPQGFKEGLLLSGLGAAVSVILLWFDNRKKKL